MKSVMLLNHITLLLVTQLWLTNSSSIPINIVNRGYTGVVVAIHKRVPEQDNIAKVIEELFKNASAALYVATRNRAFFKDITIAIPSTWKHNVKYENVTGDFFSEAHIRIDLPNPAYGDEPYTFQPRECQLPGDYIHYTPNYILKPVSQQSFRLGERYGYRLVQEWAHFRYGVMDEFGYAGDSKYPAFYFDKSDNLIHPTGCTKDFTGSPDLNENCNPDMTEGARSIEEYANCSAIPQEVESTKASIMFTAAFENTIHFCDSVDTGEGRYHNFDAPNKQNLLCNFKSTWDIVSNHLDLRGVSRGPEDADTTPTFRYVRNPTSGENRFVWVLDTSNSMKGRPIQLLHEASSRCIMDHQCITDNSQIGVVAFSNKARVLAPLTKVKTEYDRNMLVSFLPRREDYGYTAIGKGLQEAIKVLSEGGTSVEGGSSAEGGRVILVTDGEENMAPMILEVLPTLIKARVVVSAIAFGHKASEKLENLTSSTGGKLHLFSNLNGSAFGSSLDFAFLEATTTQIDVDMQPVTITRNRVESQSQSVIRPILIEKSLGKNTDFILHSKNPRNLEVILIRPNGSEITQYESFTDGLRFSIPIAENGLWQIVIKSRIPVFPTVDLFVRSTPLNSLEQPVRVRAWTSDVEIKFPASLVIYAEVKKEYTPVINAKVMATVTRPNGSMIDVHLKDNGATPDMYKDDGIYSGYFTSITGSGRYGVVATVVNDGQASLKTANNEMKRFRRDVEDVDDDLEDFERVADGGVFKVENYQNIDKDIIPPSRVTDLEISEKVHFGFTDFIVSLQWTSPGDDYNTGNASYLEVRYSDELVKLRKSFSSCILVNESSILNGELQPLPSGNRQSMTIRVQNPVELFNQSNELVNITALYFALIVMDEALNVGEMSNIVFAFFEKETRKDPIKQKRPSDDYQNAIFVLCGVVLIIIIILIICKIAITVRNKKKFMPRYEGVSTYKPPVPV